MRLNSHLIKINRNFIICFLVSAISSAILAQIFDYLEHSLLTTLTLVWGYIIYFVIFSMLFYLDNRKRYQNMNRAEIKKEIISLISSFGLGEIVYLSIRWPSLYYFLEINIEAFWASIISEIISTACYMLVVTVFLKRIKVFEK